MTSISSVFEYVFRIIIPMWEGTLVTLQLFFITLIFSIPLGLAITFARISKYKWLAKVTGIYIWLLRGTPLLLQLFFVYYGLPTFGLTFTSLVSALLAFILNYAAYFAEIFRAGIQSIDKGQHEGAKVLGFTYWQTMTRIIIPQMVRHVLPPVGNETITLVKDTALVYAISLGELLRAAKIAVNRDAVAIPFFVAAIFYLVMTLVITYVFERLEERYRVYE